MDNLTPEMEKKFQSESTINIDCPDLVREQMSNPPEFAGKPMKFALVHARGPMNRPPCGGVAFFYAEKPRANVILDPRKARLLCGEIPSTRQNVICDTCKQPIGMNQLNLHIARKRSR